MALHGMIWCSRERQGMATPSSVSKRVVGICDVGGVWIETKCI